jgi:hypothetical protein
MSGQTFWNPVRNPDESSFPEIFGGKIVFDVLNLTNSPNAFTLVVQSSWDSKKNIKSSILRNLHDFSHFLHCSPYRILFHRSYCLVECHTLQNSQHKVRSPIVGHQSSKTHTGGLDALSISPSLMIDDKHLEFFNN